MNLLVMGSNFLSFAVMGIGGCVSKYYFDDGLSVETLSHVCPNEDSTL